MSGMEPQASWIQWGLTGIGTVFTALIGLFVSFGRDAAKIYREKVDALEKGQATLTASCITREEFRDELTRRFDDTDARSDQQHVHNTKLMEGINSRVCELRDAVDSRMGELRQDIKDVHTRIDGLKKK